MGRLIRRVLFRCLRTLDDHLSRDCVTAAFQRSTRGRDEQPHSPLSDLAPGEVYRASRVTPAAGGLLHHRFTLTWRLRARRSTFCCTVSRVTPGGCYPPPCSMEPGRSSAPLLATRPSCRPIHKSSLPGSMPGPARPLRSGLHTQSGRDRPAYRVTASATDEFVRGRARGIRSRVRTTGWARSPGPDGSTRRIA
jgi:hypothetical protein